MHQHKPTGAALAVDIATLLAAAILFAGIRTLFAACGPKEDGSWMTCHHAQSAVWAVACAILVQALVKVFYRGRGMHGVKAGLSFAIAVQGAVCALLPGTFIPLCMMQSMRCHTLMRPAVTVLCVLLVIAGVLGSVVHIRQCGRHHEKTDG